MNIKIVMLIMILGLQIACAPMRGPEPHRDWHTDSPKRDERPHKENNHHFDSHRNPNKNKRPQSQRPNNSPMEKPEHSPRRR